MGQVIEVPGHGLVEFPDGMTDAQIVAAIKKNSMVKGSSGVKNIPSSAATDTAKDIPEYLRRAGSYASEGIAGLGDTVLNVPTNLYNLGKAGVGTILTAAGRPDLAPELTKNPDLVRKGFEKAGFIDPSVKPESKAESVARGLVHAGTVGMVAPAKSIPQMAGNVGAAMVSELAGQGTEEATGSREAGMAARMLAVPTVAATSNLTKAAAAKTKSLNAPRDEALKEGRKAGLVVPKSETSPSAANSLVESFAGKAALKQAASLKNQQATNALVRKELGIPESQPITVGVLKDLRARASWPYAELRAISPRANSVVDRLQDFRQKSTEQWQSYARNGKPKALRKARTADQNAAMLERTLEKFAKQAGKDDLVSELRKSRAFIAKTHDVEKALNVASGDVEMNVLGALLDKGKPLSGSLETVAKFQQNFPKFTQPGPGVPAPAVSQLNIAGHAGLSGLGWLMGGLPGMVAGAAIPFLRSPMRARLLSQGYQGSVNPSYPLASLPNQENAALRAILLGSQSE